MTAKSILFETDMCTDCDDAGALAVLHELANRGECRILGVCCNNKSRYSVGACAAMNAYFGRLDLSLGAYKGDLVGKDETVTLGYNQIAQDSSYGHRIVAREDAEDAVDFYSRLLAAQADGSVTIVSVGFLNNLSDVLKSPGGKELLAAKVKELVVMGGKYPEGREYNFAECGAAPYTLHLFDHWPARVPVVFIGFELGKEVVTGPALTATPANNPARRAYELMHKGILGRPSWDLLAVLYAVRGLADYWTVQTGQLVLAKDGGNSWLSHPSDGKKQAYLKTLMPPAQVAAVLSELLVAASK